MKQFYSHLIEIDSIIISLDKMSLSKEEKQHLAHLVDSSLHHTILDVILSQLTDEDKRIFMSHLSGGNHDKIWKLLNEKVDGVEMKIKKAADLLKTELEKDLMEAQKLK